MFEKLCVLASAGALSLADSSSDVLNITGEKITFAVLFVALLAFVLKQFQLLQAQILAQQTALLATVSENTVALVQVRDELRQLKDDRKADRHDSHLGVNDRTQ